MIGEATTRDGNYKRKRLSHEAESRANGEIANNEPSATAAAAVFSQMLQCIKRAKSPDTEVKEDHLVLHDDSATAATQQEDINHGLPFNLSRQKRSVSPVDCTDKRVEFDRRPEIRSESPSLIRNLGANVLSSFEDIDRKSPPALPLLETGGGSGCVAESEKEDEWGDSSSFASDAFDKLYDSDCEEDYGFRSETDGRRLFEPSIEKVRLRWVNFVRSVVDKSTKTEESAAAADLFEAGRTTKYLDLTNLKAFKRYEEQCRRSGWLLFAAEYPVFSDEALIAGKIDAVYIPDPEVPNQVVLVDWKRCDIDFGTKYSPLAKGMRVATGRFPTRARASGDRVFAVSAFGEGAAEDRRSFTVALQSFRRNVRALRRVVGSLSKIVRLVAGFRRRGR